MEAALTVCLAALAASALTLISGFGLGTLLTPVFALFFPVEAAVAATAVVHLANNLFKVGLVGRHARLDIVLRFGLPAAGASLLGALALVYVASLPPVASYEAFGAVRHVTPVKLVIGVLIGAFALAELSSRVAALAIPARFLPLGGVLSGFFGGLSGNQGALRSAFLIKAGLSKEAYIGTGIVCAVIVDIVRLTTYGASQVSSRFEVIPDGAENLVLLATLSAFTGAYIGVRMMHKITLRAVQLVVAIMMLAVGTALATGFI
jgi:uncharacterized membrane protein YfcA